MGRSGAVKEWLCTWVTPVRQLLNDPYCTVNVFGVDEYKYILSYSHFF